MLCQYGFLSQDVLLNVVEPPSEEAMDNAMQRLQDVGALDEEEVREMKIFYFQKLLCLIFVVPQKCIDVIH